MVTTPTAIWRSPHGHATITEVWKRRRGTTLEDVVELLQGIGRILMGISAKLDAIIELLGDDDEEAES